MTAIYQNIWSQGNYIYHTVSSGIDVYSDDASSLLYHISTPVPSVVWANDSYVYIGTTLSGVYRAAISGTASPYKQEPNLTSNETIYLHGAGDYLCVSTVSGVDRFNTDTSARIYTTISDVHKCFQTVSGTLYYIENVAPAKLHAVYTPSVNWASPDYTYDDFYATPDSINDIYVTSGTIFLGTNRGACVIEELQGNETNARKKYFFRG